MEKKKKTIGGKNVCTSFRVRVVGTSGAGEGE